MTIGEMMWSAVVFFFLVALAAMFITVFAEVLRREDLSGWAKAGWAVVLLALPLIGILVYVIVRPKSIPSNRSESSTSASAFPSDRIPTMGMRP